MKRTLLTLLLCLLSFSIWAEEEQGKNEEEKWYQYDHLYFQFSTSMAATPGSFRMNGKTSISSSLPA